MNYKYICETCNYSTNDHFNYKRHISSKKHKRRVYFQNQRTNGDRRPLKGPSSPTVSKNEEKIVKRRNDLLNLK